MKKILLFSFTLIAVNSFSQKLVWTSQTGGDNNNGAIIQHDLQTQQTSTLGSLEGNFMRGFDLTHEVHLSEEEYNTEGLIAGSDGNMYGVSTQISSHAQQQLGGIYKIETATNKLVLLHTFSGERVPRHDLGVFNYSALDHGLRNPVFGLIEATPGVFYGITNHGGLYGEGGIYKFDANGAGYSKVLDFDTLSSGGLGLGPLSPLIIGKDGNLFGVLYYVPTEAPADQGFLYKIDITTDVVSIEAPLGAAGWAISGPVCQIAYSAAGNGKIYGTKEEFTASGHGGGIYSYDFGSGTVTNETIILTVDAVTLGEYGHGISPVAANGRYYFLTRAGGANGAGTLMEYNAGLNTMLKKHDFSTSPNGTGIIVNGSKVYGTYNQFTSGQPILWSYDVGSEIFSDVLTGTNDNTLGYYMSPSFSIVNGELFGITLLGGSSNAGSLFRHNLGTGQTTIIQNNQSVEGRGLAGEMTIINDSIAYAHILAGGEEIVSGESAEQGGLARINLVTGSVQLDAMNSAFLNDSRTISYKYNAPLYSQSENLYVSHYYGVPGQKRNHLDKIDLTNGTNNQVMGSDVERLTYGALEYQPGKIMYNLTNGIFVYDELTQISTQYPVTPSDSGFMCNNIILASNGKVYGTTTAPGVLDLLKKCMIYSVDTNTFVRSVEYVFNSPVKELNNGLTEVNGKLYGSTIAGGTNGDGYLFSYDMTSGILTIEYSFDASVDGGAFLGEWTVYNGVLYAVSFAGGANGYGTLASFDLTNSTFTVLEDFTIDNGRALRATPALWDDAWLSIDENTLNDVDFIIYPNPTDRYLHLENGNIENVSVYSIEGRLEKVEFTESLIDLQGLAPGVYIISIDVPEGQCQKRVVIK